MLTAAPEAPGSYPEGRRKKNNESQRTKRVTLDTGGLCWAYGVLQNSPEASRKLSGSFPEATPEFEAHGPGGGAQEALRGAPFQLILFSFFFIFAV